MDHFFGFCHELHEFVRIFYGFFYHGALALHGFFYVLIVGVGLGWGFGEGFSAVGCLGEVDFGLQVRLRLVCFGNIMGEGPRC